MKKLLLTLIAAVALCGSIFAQPVSTPWGEFNFRDYKLHSEVWVFAKINDVYITETDNWQDYQIGAFVGNEIRGIASLDFDPSYGDPYPSAQVLAYYDNAGESLTFKLYDISTDTHYDICTANMDLFTGTDYDAIVFAEYDDAVVLNFSSVFYTKTIEGYGTSDGGYYLIAPPVDNVDPADVQNMTYPTGDEYAFFDLYAFDQEQELQWINYKQHTTDFKLASGHGYLYANKNDAELKFSGEKVEGETFPVRLVKKAGTGDWEGWNLVGNPFTENVAYLADGRDFYVMNQDRDGFITAEYKAIDPMEGLFVIANNDEEELIFTINDPGVSKSAVTLNLSDSRHVIDRAILRFGEERQLPKLQLDENSTKVCFQKEGHDFAVVSSDDEGSMPVYFKAEENGRYNFDFKAENVDFAYLHLIDSEAGEDIDLIQSPSYSFDALTTDPVSRFKIIYAKTTTGVNENFAFISDGQIIITGVENGANVQLIDALGRIVANGNGIQTVSTEGMSAGVYVIRLINGSNIQTQKIVVE